MAYPQLPDSNLSSSAMNLLHETHMPSTQNPQQTLARSDSGMDLTQDFASPLPPTKPGRLVMPMPQPLLEILAQTEATSPIKEAGFIPLRKVKKNTSNASPPRTEGTTKQKRETNPNAKQGAAKRNSPPPSPPISECTDTTSVYISFPPYVASNTIFSRQKEIARRCCRKIGSYIGDFLTKFGNSAQAIGNFYAHSEQKWDNEYPPYEPSKRPKPTALQTTDVFDKPKREKARTKEERQQKSLAGIFKNYWKPRKEPQGAEVESNRSTDNQPPRCSGEDFSYRPSGADENRLPGRVGGEENKKRERTTRIMTSPSIPEELRATLQKRCACETFPHPRSSVSAADPTAPSAAPTYYSLRRGDTLQPRLKHHRKPDRRSSRGQDRRERQQADKGVKVVGEEVVVVVEEEEEEEEEAEDIGTPWSGLDTVVEEEFLEQMPEGGCTGVEAGEPCMRHEVCMKEAMAVGGGA